MKKFLALALGVTLSLSLLTACGNKGETDGENLTIKVAATPAPHAIILEEAKAILAEEGVTLVIQEFTDYVQPNMATESGDVMANYFQHVAYLDSFNENNGTHLVSVGGIHYEPYGLYIGKTAAIADLQEGAQIAVPNDPSNEARALMLLEDHGLLTLRDGVGLNATKLDIIENPLNLEIVEMEAAQLPGALSSVDMAVINGNYALDAGLNFAEMAVASEEANEEVLALYQNVLVVKEGSEEDPAVQALVKALKSDRMRDFINEKYEGAVVPLD